MAENENRLIELLGRAERKRVIERCEPFEMQLSAVIHEAPARTRHVYFPLDGFISLVIEVDGRHGLEVGMVGSEGMLGGELLLGHATARWRAVVQGAGTALRMKGPVFMQTLTENPGLRQLVGRYLGFRLEQLTRAAACERFHEIGPRLARWLLMSQDRAEDNTFRMTHEFLSFMLGVRRVGVTVAASELQRLGCISYHRGEITVLSRAGLETQACSCYASNHSLYGELVN